MNSAANSSLCCIGEVCQEKNKLLTDLHTCAFRLYWPQHNHLTSSNFFAYKLLAKTTEAALQHIEFCAENPDSFKRVPGLYPSLFKNPFSSNNVDPSSCSRSIFFYIVTTFTSTIMQFINSIGNKRENTLMEVR